MEKSTLQRLNTLAHQLQALYQPIDIIHHTAPLNRDTEKQQFLEAYTAGKVYNPQFTYHAPPPNWDAPLQQFMTELRPDDDPWEEWIAQDVDFNLNLMQATVNRDPELTTTATVRNFGKPSDSLVQMAYAALSSLPVAEEPPTLAAEEMAAKMQESLINVGLSDWSVLVVETMSARISVRSVDKQVKVRAGCNFTSKGLKRLLVHEIGTHVFRSVNGELQPLKLLQFGLYRYVLTEEGLANYHEAQYGVQTAVDQQRYALRVIAAHLSLTQSFYQVFCEIVQYTTVDEAFEIVTRAKRGFTDTSVPGCHVKDKVYFEGFHLVSDHLAQHPENYSLLMCGKVALDMLPLLQELQESGWLIQPQYLPEQLIHGT